MCRNTAFVILLATVCGWYQTVVAQGPAKPSPTAGWSGYIEPMGIYISRKSQLRNTEDDNRRIVALDDAGARSDYFRGGLLGKIAYRFADSKTQLYAGVPLENISTGQFQVELGVNQGLPGGTELNLAYLPVIPGIAAETWRDPFVVGEDRQQTDIESSGVKLAANKIFGSGFNLKYYYATQELDEERSGEYLFSLPGSTLTRADLDDIKRDSRLHRVEGEYARMFADRWLFKPALRYTRVDADGDAYSFDSWQARLSLLYLLPRHSFSINLYVDRAEFDKRHPIFDKTRDDQGFGAFVGYSYHQPFGWKDVRVDWYNAYLSDDSNIDFYDTETFISALGLAYSFGS